uniref:Ig-like domain-containing protein n=1 Tax=Peromyscus maniculatus bairdii TaxID=230844 RepID=A0A8C8UIP7_PERMB
VLVLERTGHLFYSHYHRINFFLSFDFSAGSNLSQKVTQVQSTASTQEGEEVTLDCSYETSQNLYHLFWYKQLLSGEMIFLIRQISSSTRTERSSRYSVVFQKSTKSISLVISASQLEDSVKYYCALWEPTHSV